MSGDLTPQALDPEQAQTLSVALATYAEGRRVLLQALGCPTSMRDPLSEFAEQYVAALLGGQLAQSRVQKAWDLRDHDGRTVQVRYLANATRDGTWVNEHLVSFEPGVDRYALVVLIDLAITAVVVFQAHSLSGVCTALGKRHPNQDRTLQFTRRNLQQIMAEPERFAPYGVLLFRPKNSSR